SDLKAACKPKFWSRCLTNNSSARPSTTIIIEAICFCAFAPPTSPLDRYFIVGLSRSMNNSAGSLLEISPRDDHFLEHHFLNRPIAKIPRHVGDCIDDVLAFYDLAEDAVFAVQPWGRFLDDEELATVGVGSGVGHGQDARFGVLEIGIEFVLEAISRTAGAVAQRIAPLDHKAGDNAMKDRAVVKRPFHFRSSLRIGPFLGARR